MSNRLDLNRPPAILTSHLKQIMDTKLEKNETPSTGSPHSAKPFIKSNADQFKQMIRNNRLHRDPISDPSKKVTTWVKEECLLKCAEFIFQKVKCVKPCDHGQICCFKRSELPMLAHNSKLTRLSKCAEGVGAVCYCILCTLSCGYSRRPDACCWNSNSNKVAPLAPTHQEMN